MLVVVDLYVEAGEIEAVGQVLFVNFAKVFIATGGDKLNHEYVSKYTLSSAETGKSDGNPEWIDRQARKSREAEGCIANRVHDLLALLRT